MKNGNVWVIISLIAMGLGILFFKNYQINSIVTDDDFFLDYADTLDDNGLENATFDTLKEDTLAHSEQNSVVTSNDNSSSKSNIDVQTISKKEIVKKETNNSIWNYNSDTKALTILGNTADYNEGSAPWYKYAPNIKTIRLEKGVTYIGNYAFAGLSNVKNIYFNSDLKNIGNYAFSNIGVEYIILPDSVEKIGEYAFANNNSMKVLVLSNNLKIAPANLARNSKNLELVIFGNNTKEIGEKALYGCNLVKLVIPNKNFTLGSQFIDSYNKVGLDIWGPTSIKSYAESFSNVYYFSIDKYRPMVYGNSETYNIEFDDLHYGSNGSFTIKTLTNASASFKEAKYMYKTSSGDKILMEGLNYSGTTLKNVKLDVYIDASVSGNGCTTSAQTVYFIGNSLTNGFGHGMAASDEKSDYVYYVMKYMNNMNANSEYFRYVTNPFENATTSSDRNSMVEKMIKSLESKRNKNKPVKTIFLQYGTNSTSTEERATFTKDSIYLINRLKETYPGVKIYWIVALAHPKTIALIKEAINATNITFVDASYMRGTERYASYIGAKYTRNGKVYRIDSGGVAGHPGDYGFTRMANTTIDTLKQTNYCANF